MAEMMLLFLVLFPTVCAPLCYWIGKKNKRKRDDFVAAATGLELAAALVLMFSGEAAVRIDGVLGLGLSFAADGFRSLMALIAAIGWFEATLMLREYFAHSRNRNRYYMFWLLTLTGTLSYRTDTLNYLQIMLKVPPVGKVNKNVAAVLHV